MDNQRISSKKILKMILGIVVSLCVIQILFLVTKQIVFSSITETLYTRSVVTCISMVVVFIIMVLFCKRKQYSLSIFPKVFGPLYIVATIIGIVFYAITLLCINGFTIPNAFLLFYGSIITPIFEELLFRGAIWNRLNCVISKECITFLLVTLLFSLWHIGYAVGIYLWNGGNLLQCLIMKVLVGAVFGIITGVIRYKTKNCYVGIIAHGVLNALG